MNKVLITNGQLRKALAAVRSLGSKGIEVYVAEETRFCPSAFSKYCRGVFVHPSPSHKPEEFHRWLVKTIEGKKIDILYPMDDNTISVVMKHRREYERICKMLLPPEEGFYTAFDKGRFSEAAREAGIDCPLTYTPESLEDMDSISGRIQYPVMIKPRFSSGTRGIRFAGSQKELVENYREVNSRFQLPVIQEYLGNGSMYDVTLLFNRESELRGSFVYNEVRKFPVDRGPSTVQKSIWMPELVEKCEAFLKKLGWVGVADLEFMQDEKSGKLKLIEINPRYWNSLFAAINAGIDFPWLQYLIITEGDCSEALGYEDGLYSRNLLPGDLLHYIANRGRKRIYPPFCGKGSGVMKDDMLSKEDPGPVIGFILACLRYLPDINMWKFMFKR